MKPQTGLLLIGCFLLLNGIISYIATQTIPYLGHFSYPDLLEKADLPHIIERFASFDGTHYIRISQMGYHQNSTAFFPLLPLLIFVFHTMTRIPPILVGQILSVTLLGGIIWVLPRYLRLLGVTESHALWSLLFFLAFPTSFFLQSVYTESLFIFLMVASLYYSFKKQYILAALCGYLTGMTRIVGLFLAVPLFFQYLSQENATNLQQIKNQIVKLLRKPQLLLSFCSPLLGFVTICIFFFIRTGDPFAFFTAQDTFSAGRSTHLILFPQVIYRYLKIFVTADMSFAYFVATVEFVSFLFAGTILLLDLWNIWRKKYQHNLTRLGLNLFAIVMLLLPTFTGTFLSMPRFILPMLPIFLYLGQWENRSVKYAVLSIFILLHVVLLMAFIQGYFIS